MTTTLIKKACSFSTMEATIVMFARAFTLPRA